MASLTALKYKSSYRRLLLTLQVFVFLSLVTKGQSQTETFTGNGTFIVPAGVTSITVECWGAGGGGSRITNNQGRRGGGGGGGAYAMSVLTVTPGTSYSVFVGTGGGSNTDGGNTYFGSNLVLAEGGKGGSNNSTTGAAGGAASNSIGNVVYSGGNGANGGSYWSGGGGGGAGSSGAGGNASGNTGGTGTASNGGNGANGVAGSSDGNNGYSYGGGGSGAVTNSNTNRSGGSGADGLVIVSYCAVASMGYNFERNITIDYNYVAGGNDLYNFPLLVTLSGQTFLQNTPNGDIENTNGYDIIFTDENYGKLDHQVEYYNGTSGDLIAWVRIPVLSSSTNTVIKILYGNSQVSSDPSTTDVWDSHYKGVWHMNNSSLNDATVFNKSGTPFNNPSYTGGVINNAILMNGTNQYAEVQNDPNINFNGNITVSAWVYMNSRNRDQKIAGNQNNSSGGYKFGIYSNNKVEFEIRNSSNVASLNRDVAGGTVLNTGEWYYLAGISSDVLDSIKTVVNGVSERPFKKTGTLGTASNTLSIGKEPFLSDYYFAGMFDELRISDEVRSDGWLMTEYNNHASPSAFYTLDATETESTNLPSESLCSGPITLTFGFPAGGTYSGNAYISGDVFTPPSAGTYPITYTYDGGCGPVSVTKNFIITDAPSAPVASNMEYCTGQITYLEATGENIKWYSGGTLVSTANPFSTGQTVPGTYNYTVTQTTNGCESPATNVTLTIVTGTTINTQPSPVSICEGSNATFAISATGYHLSYQWQEDGVNITDGGIYSGATTSTLTLTNPGLSESGKQYTCVLTSTCGTSTVTSSSALLTVNPTPSVTFGYDYSMDITLNQASGSSDLTDFPALISLTNSNLKTSSNGGHVLNTNGYDIIFTDQNGNKLDHQIESYDAATGNYTAWVRIPVLSHTSTTLIKIFYGNQSVSTDPSVKSVWTSNYKGVWHLNGTDYTDGTSYANDGTENATSDIAGKIAGGKGFNGSTSYIRVTTDGFVPNNNNQTISVWGYYSSAPVDNRNLVSFQNTGASSAIQLGFRAGHAVAWKWGGVVLADGGADPSVNTWHYYVYTYDGTTSRIYIDGAEINSSTVAPQTALPSEGNIGRYNNGEYFNGFLDEVRFSMSPKSAGWIQTEYDNQNNPASFISVGTEVNATLLTTIGVCSTTFTLDQGLPAGGTYSGTGVSGTNFNASAAGVGTHAITYTYTNASGCSRSAVRNIIVTPLPGAPAAADKECCVSNITDLDATGSNLQWYSDPGLTTLAGSGTPFATGQTTAGVYTYYVTQSVNGCESAATTVTLTILPGTAIDTQPSAVSICEGGNATFTISATGYNITYQWQENGVKITDGGIYSGATTSSLTLTNPGLTKNGMQYRCIITSTCGTSPVTSNSALLTVNPSPSATFSYAGTPYCPNATNPLPTFSGGGVAGVFSSTSGLIFANTSTGEIDLTSSTPGLYTITNTIAASGGCSEVTATSPLEIVSSFTWTGSAGTDWNNSANWSCGMIPNGNTSVIIPNVGNKPVISSGNAGDVDNITINTGSSLTISGNSINIKGTITNNGTFTSSNGSVIMNGTTAQVINAGCFEGNTLKDLTVNNPAGVSLTGPLNVTGVVTLQNGNLASDGNLTLVSSVGQTALISGSGSGNVTGTVTMQRYLAVGFGYKYFSSPFQSATVNEFSDDMSLGYFTFYKYDESRTGSGWVSYYTTTNPLLPLTGYAANFGSSTSPNTVDLSGAVNNGSLSITLYNHNNTYTKGFNLIGNPYPSPIDWDAPSGWTKTNIDNALYYFKASSTDQYGGTYRSYINGISSDGTASNIIPSMQGFFIHVSDGSYPVTGTLTMDNSVRIDNLTHPFSKSLQVNKPPVLRLTAGFSDDTFSSDPVVVYFDEKAGSVFDTQLDALKLLNTDYSVTNLYVVSQDGLKLSVDALPAIADDSTAIPLGLKINRDGDVVFRISDLDPSLANRRIILSDLAARREKDLQNAGEYVVKLTSGEYNNRFILNITSIATGTYTETEDSGLFSVYCSKGILKTTIDNIYGGEGLIRLYNLTGQIMFLQKIYDKGYYELSPGVKDGIYVISYSSGPERVSKKIYIHNR